MKPRFQFGLGNLCLATALVAVPFSLEGLDTPVFVVATGFLWGCAVGVLAAHTKRAVLWFGVAGIAALSAWTGLVLALE
ncbi:MAG: hypothetical protein U0836_21955 [Pirellulales bacterium]